MRIFAFISDDLLVVYLLTQFLSLKASLYFFSRRILFQILAAPDCSSIISNGKKKLEKGSKNVDMVLLSPFLCHLPFWHCYLTLFFVFEHEMSSEHIKRLVTCGGHESHEEMSKYTFVLEFYVHR